MTPIRWTLLPLLAWALLARDASGQGLNMGFDDADPASGAPVGWNATDARPVSGGLGYELATVPEAHEGSGAARLRFVGPGHDEGPDYGSFTQGVDAEPFRGRRVRLSGWLRTAAVVEGAGLWMRVDGAEGLLAFDNMSDRFARGETDWARHEVVLDVSPGAERVVFGLLLLGRGTAWADSLHLDVVGDDVAATTLIAPEPFDDVPAPQPVLDWIRRSAVSLDVLDPRARSRELLPFVRTLDAQVVGLGVPNLGSREPQLVRHRLVKALVEQRSQLVVALDIDWPTGLYLDQWVRRGRGDPRAELAALPDWSWRQQEILDLLLWLRDWNRGATSDQRVRLAGINGRHVGSGHELALSFLERVSPADAETLRDELQPLLDAEADNHRAGDEELARAADGLARLLARFDEARPEWTAATSSKAWTRARHLIEVLGQAVDLSRSRADAPRVDASSRADNVEWLLAQLGGEGAVVILAPNDGVALDGAHDLPNLGEELRARLGEGYVSVGATFGQGSFRARDGRTRDVRAYDVGPGRVGSLGQTLSRAVDGPVLLDLRAAPPLGPVDAWLRRPHRLRTIGPWYSENAAELFRRPRVLTDAFHALVHVPETSLGTPLGDP